MQDDHNDSDYYGRNVEINMQNVDDHEIEKHLDRICEVLGAGEDAIIVPFSATTKMGLDTLNDFMDQVIENEKE